MRDCHNHALRTLGLPDALDCIHTAGVAPIRAGVLSLRLEPRLHLHSQPASSLLSALVTTGLPGCLQGARPIPEPWQHDTIVSTPRDSKKAAHESSQAKALRQCMWCGSSATTPAHDQAPLHALPMGLPCAAVRPTLGACRTSSVGRSPKKYRGQPHGQRRRSGLS